MQLMWVAGKIPCSVPSALQAVKFPFGNSFDLSLWGGGLWSLVSLCLQLSVSTCHCSLHVLPACSVWFLRVLFLFGADNIQIYSFT